jgi:C-terminal processing protease CtpA/Prc
MNKKTAVAIATGIAILMVAGVLLFVFQPQKQVSHRPPQRITDDAPRITEFVGVGLMLRNDTGGHTVVVQQVVPNSPAAEAHISSGMIVSKVDDVSLEGKPLADCVNLIRGPAGTTMRLELVTPDHSQTNIVELTRRKINL